MTFISNRMLSLVAKIQARRLQAEEEGQTLVEYGLILALISIVAIAALGLIGDNVTAVFDSIAGTLGSAI